MIIKKFNKIWRNETNFYGIPFYGPLIIPFSIGIPKVMSISRMRISVAVNA